MAWKIAKRIAVASKLPTITINKGRFSYNAALSRAVDFEMNKYVSYFFDEDTRRIGFAFSKIQGEHSSKITGSSAQGYSSYSTELFRIPWINKAGITKGSNKYESEKDGSKWVITLRPVFERSFNRESVREIDSEIRGIYRYIDEGKIVYIGKGIIKERLAEEQRKEWKFNLVEFSVIKDEDDQYNWERYWLDVYKNENGDHLPPYNLISGRRKTEE